MCVRALIKFFKRSNKSIQTILVLLGLSFYGPLCKAEKPDEKLKFFFFTIEPYAYKLQNETLGIYPQVAFKIAKEFRQELNVELVPFPRLATSLLSEKNSITFSFETESLKTKTKQLDTLMEVDSVVASLNSEKTSRQSKPVLTIGRMRGGCLDLKAENFSAFKFEELDNFESGFKMLISNRIDGICATRDVVSHYIKVLKINPKLMEQPKIISKRKVYIYVNPAMPDLLQANLKKKITDLKKSGL